VPTFEAASQGFQQLGVAQPPQLVKSGYQMIRAFAPDRPDEHLSNYLRGTEC
jgi:hypothetical protein